MQEKEETVVTAGFDPRHLLALDYIRTVSGFSTKVDAVRKSVIEYAKILGWPDPNGAMPPAPNRKAAK